MSCVGTASRLSAFDRVLQGHEDADDLRRSVFAADPDATAQSASAVVTDEQPSIQMLPAEVQLNSVPRADAGNWIDIYVDHVTKIVPMTPHLFLEASALWLASVVVARRLVVPMPFAAIYPNLWIMWIATTTLYRKSTAMNIARAIGRKHFAHLFLAGRATPEALFADLAGQEPTNYDRMTEDERRQWDGGRDYAAQRGLALDEASALLSSTSRDYNAGLLEDFLRLYDCEELAQRITRSQGLISVHNAYLPILASSTPVALASYLRDNQLWSMGWWPRYAILTPDPGLPEYRETDYLATEPAALAGTLRHLDERLPQAQWPDRPTPLTVTLGEKVLPSWKTYNKTMSYDLLLDPALDERLHGLYGRMPTHAIKVAMLLAALDWPADRVAPQIELHHLARAVDIAERWRASAHRALGQATQTEAGTLRE